MTSPTCQIVLAQAGGLSQYFSQLSDIGIAAIAFGVLVLFLCAIGFSYSEFFRWVMMGGTLFAFILTRPKEDEYWDRTLSPIMQLLSDYSRPLGVGLMIAMFLGAVFVRNNIRKTYLSAPHIAFFAFQMLICANFLGAGAVQRGIVTPLVYIMMIVSVCYGLGATLNTVAACRTALWCLVVTVAVTSVITLLEYAIRPGSVVSGSRLFAITYNPQAAGSMFAFIMPVVLHLISTTGDMKTTLLKPALCLFAALLVIFIMWTGSRAALLAAVIGVSVLFFDRLSVLPVVGGAVALLVWLLSGVYGEAVSTGARLTSREDTRSGPWLRMIEMFLDNPVFGDDMTRSSAGESSYLSAAALMGIFGIIAITLLMIATAHMAVCLLKSRRELSEDPRLANLIVSGLASYFVISIFDGYLLGSTTFHVMFLYLYYTIGGALIAQADARIADRAAAQRMAVSMQPPGYLPHGAS